MMSRPPPYRMLPCIVVSTFNSIGSSTKRSRVGRNGLACVLTFWLDYVTFMFIDGFNFGTFVR